MTVVGARLRELTDDRLLRRNVLHNIAGWALPAIAAIVSLPLLARGLGPARFGLVVLAWSTVTMFTQFDFGIGRALTRIIAQRLASHDQEGIADIVWTASWLLLGLTAILGVAGAIVAPSIVDGLLHVPIELRGEVIFVIRLLSLSLPVLAHAVALRGVLEAGQRFRVINQLRIPLGVANYAGPLLVLVVPGGDARLAVGIIVTARVVYWIAHFFVLDAMVPGIATPRGLSRPAVRELATVGGWITVSNVLSPIIVQADRVVVAISFPIAASGWYGTAAELATKQWLFSSALQPVLFSALSAAIKPWPERAAVLMHRATKLTAFVLLPAAATLAIFAAPVLRLWMRSAYAPEAVPVLRWLAVAVYINASAQVPYAVLQGGVDSRAPALLHMIEVPIYVALLVILPRHWGVQGVAVAWLLRMTGDSAAMWWLLGRRFHAGRAAIRSSTWLVVACTSLLIVAAIWGARRFPA